jgi:hypothetical protein
MFRTASLSTKLIRIGASLLVVALASISLTLVGHLAARRRRRGGE